MKLPISCFLAVLLSAFCCFAGDVKINDRIINGDRSRFYALGYIVSITENGEHFCSGFIYNNKSVITAASCVEKKVAPDLRVIINQFSLTNQDPAEEEILVLSISINEYFNSTTLFHDIAILQLSKELELIPSAETTYSNPGPSCLKHGVVLPCEQLYPASFYGWGFTEFDVLSENLRNGKVNISPNDVCVEHYGAEFDGSLMICGSNVASGATGLLTGPCNFDEGGPLVVVDKIASEYVAVGIYSKNKDCDVNIPSVYTRLAVYGAWIYQIAGPPPSFNCFSEFSE